MEVPDKARIGVRGLGEPLGSFKPLVKPVVLPVVLPVVNKYNQ